MSTPEEIAADTLYQAAVLRVYSPWLASDVMSGAERRTAFARVQHARLVLSMRGLALPPVAPAEYFNEKETLQWASGRSSR
ncbi:hypothetical protein [Actinomadura rubrisoli]|uniref:Uncharacterized protein n=1 Tax=Actinomadura rubrisoli TaxID=2530368 RepID=A0A4R5BIC4_9ACTN|nr:hypothetical protein [Actinomadura rubrisoli]TDD86418.1 hypothetical protein E1298_17435 [Actinomadura rubrisoli]